MERVEFKLTNLENSLLLAINNSAAQANDRATSLELVINDSIKRGDARAERADARAERGDARAERMEALLEQILNRLEKLC